MGEWKVEGLFLGFFLYGLVVFFFFWERLSKVFAGIVPVIPPVKRLICAFQLSLRLPTCLPSPILSQAMLQLAVYSYMFEHCTPISIRDLTHPKKQNPLWHKVYLILPSPSPPLSPLSLTPPSFQRRLQIPLRNPHPRAPPRHQPGPHPRLRPRPPPRLPPPRRPKPRLHGPAGPLPPHGLPVLARHPAAVPALAERAERGGERGRGDGAADGGDQVWG